MRRRQFNDGSCENKKFDNANNTRLAGDLSRHGLLPVPVPALPVLKPIKQSCPVHPLRNVEKCCPRKGGGGVGNNGIGAMVPKGGGRTCCGVDAHARGPMEPFPAQVFAQSHFGGKSPNQRCISAGEGSSNQAGPVALKQDGRLVEAHGNGLMDQAPPLPLDVDNEVDRLVKVAKAHCARETGCVRRKMQAAMDRMKQHYEQELKDLRDFKQQVMQQGYGDGGPGATGFQAERRDTKEASVGVERWELRGSKDGDQAVQVEMGGTDPQEAEGMLELQNHVRELSEHIEEVEKENQEFRRINEELEHMNCGLHSEIEDLRLIIQKCIEGVPIQPDFPSYISNVPSCLIREREIEKGQACSQTERSAADAGTCMTEGAYVQDTLSKPLSSCPVSASRSTVEVNSVPTSTFPSCPGFGQVGVPAARCPYPYGGDNYDDSYDMDPDGDSQSIQSALSVGNESRSGTSLKISVLMDISNPTGTHSPTRPRSVPMPQYPMDNYSDGARPGTVPQTSQNMGYPPSTYPVSVRGIITGYPLEPEPVMYPSSPTSSSRIEFALQTQDILYPSAHGTRSGPQYAQQTQTPQGSRSNLARTPQGSRSNLARTPQGSRSNLVRTPQGSRSNLAQTPQWSRPNSAQPSQQSMVSSCPYAQGSKSNSMLPSIQSSVSNQNFAPQRGQPPFPQTDQQPRPTTYTLQTAGPGPPPRSPSPSVASFTQFKNLVTKCEASPSTCPLGAVDMGVIEKQYVRSIGEELLSVGKEIVSEYVKRASVSRNPADMPTGPTSTPGTSSIDEKLGKVLSQLKLMDSKHQELSGFVRNLAKAVCANNSAFAEKIPQIEGNIQKLFNIVEGKENTKPPGSDPANSSSSPSANTPSTSAQVTHDPAVAKVTRSRPSLTEDEAASKIQRFYKRKTTGSIDPGGAKNNAGDQKQ